MMVFSTGFFSPRISSTPGSRRTCPLEFSGVDICPQGPDLLTSPLPLISSHWFNINPERVRTIPQIPGADTLCRTSAAWAYLAAWLWLPWLAWYTASMVRGTWWPRAGQRMCKRPEGWGFLPKDRGHRDSPQEGLMYVVQGGGHGFCLPEWVVG